MKVIFSKILAIGGACAALAMIGSVAGAQEYHHRDMRWEHQHQMVRRDRERINRLQAEYAHDIRVGNYAGARRAHLRASAIRAELRHYEYARFDRYGGGY